MLRRSWQAALLAAAVMLAAHAARADEKPTKGSSPHPSCNLPAFLSEVLSYGLADECCEGKSGCNDGAKCGPVHMNERNFNMLSCKSKDGCKCCKESGKCENGSKCAKCGTTAKAACAGCTGKCAQRPSVNAVFIVLPPGMMPPMPVCAGCPACMMPSCPVGPSAPSVTFGPLTAMRCGDAPVPPPLPPTLYNCPTNVPPMPVCPMQPAPVAEDSGLSCCDTCLSLLGMVADVCGSHAQPLSLPSLCASALSLAMDLCGEMGVSQPSPCYVHHPPNYVPPSPTMPTMQEPRPVAVLPPPLPDYPSYGTPYSAPHPMPLPPPGMPCSLAAATPAPVCVATVVSTPKMRIAAQANGDQLEMCVGNACVCCKKMTVKLGDCALTVTRLDDKVRLRGETLRATAACVRTDATDCLVLEGGAVLRFTKAGQQPQFIRAKCIELNLRTGAMMLNSSGKATETILQSVGSVPD